MNKFDNPQVLSTILYNQKMRMLMPSMNEQITGISLSTADIEQIWYPYGR